MNIVFLMALALLCVCCGGRPSEKADAQIESGEFTFWVFCKVG